MYITKYSLKIQSNACPISNKMFEKFKLGWYWNRERIKFETLFTLHNTLSWYNNIEHFLTFRLMLVIFFRTWKPNQKLIDLLLNEINYAFNIFIETKQSHQKQNLQMCAYNKAALPGDVLTKFCGLLLSNF